MLLTEGIERLGARAVRERLSIGVENRTNTSAGLALIAVNPEGTRGAHLLGELNRDGHLDGGDIDPFFQCLGGNCP